MTTVMGASQKVFIVTSSLIPNVRSTLILQ